MASATRNARHVRTLCGTQGGAGEKGQLRNGEVLYHDGSADEPKMISQRSGSRKGAHTFTA